MNARIYDEWMQRFRAEHCPPSDAYVELPRGNAATRTGEPFSVRGKIVYCGDSPAPRFGLLRTNGRTIALIGDTTVVARLAGMDVTVSGERSIGGRQRWPRLDVKRAIVRASAGRPAWDGILRREGGRAFLELTSGGQLAVPVVPGSLEGAEGLRVWIVGPLDSPSGAGVIGRRRDR